MTFLNMVEEIRDMFPNVIEQQIRKDINTAMRKYCNDTKILKDYVNLFSDWMITQDGAYIITQKAGQRIATEASPNWHNYVFWNLKEIWDRINKVYDVVFLDAEGKQLYEYDSLCYEIWKNGFIKFYDVTEGDIDEIPASIDDIQLHFIAHPKPLRVIVDESSENYDMDGVYLELDDEPEYENHHGAIVAEVLRKYYSRYSTMERVGQDGSRSMVKDVGMLRYYKSEYQDYVIKGIKDANISKDLTPIQITSRGY